MKLVVQYILTRFVSEFAMLLLGCLRVGFLLFILLVCVNERLVIVIGFRGSFGIRAQWLDSYLLPCMLNEISCSPLLIDCTF